MGLPVIADSSAWIELLRGRRSAAGRRLETGLRAGERILMPDVVLQEVLQGARDPRHFVRLQEQLEVVEPFVPQAPRETAVDVAGGTGSVDTWPRGRPNAVPATATATLDVRIVPRQHPEEMERLQGRLKRLRHERRRHDAWLTVEIARHKERPS